MRRPRQKTIDDNPETGAVIPSTKDSAGLVIRYDNSLRHPAHLGADRCPAPRASSSGSSSAASATAKKPPPGIDYIAWQFIKARHDDSAVPVNDLHPVATLNFDGVNPRGSVDFTPVCGSVLAARWTPEKPASP